MVDRTGRTNATLGNSRPPPPHHQQQQQQQTTQPEQSQQSQPPKKKKKKLFKKRKHRRESFIAAEDATNNTGSDTPRDPTQDLRAHAGHRDSLYRLSRAHKSDDSLDSEALLDHRESGPLQARRQSLWGGGPSPQPGSSQTRARFHRTGSFFNFARDAPPEGSDADENTALLAASGHKPHPTGLARITHMLRRNSRGSSTGSPITQDRGRDRSQIVAEEQEDFDVNNPPSVPGTPRIDAVQDFADTVYVDMENGDTIIPIDQEPSIEQIKKRLTLVEDDVCFPQDIISELADEDAYKTIEEQLKHRRRRRKAWPDIEILQAWRIKEMEEQAFDSVRAQKINEPLLVEGRLRPRRRDWHREQAAETVFRFTYFNEEIESTIHSHTISELVGPELTFDDLFNPKPPVISQTSSDNEDESSLPLPASSSIFRDGRRAISQTRQMGSMNLSSDPSTGVQSPQRLQSPPPGPPIDIKGLRYGPKPLFWLDVLSPTETEMRILAKAFGIHPLTTEDIMSQEEREKVELFRNYYFVSYRSFEQDKQSEDYLEPVSMYVVVFKDGVISFHFSQTPHPANVRRRIRQLSDYLFLTPDWISYALIDDITDAYAPLIEAVEDEVDDIDQMILDMHSTGDDEITLKTSSEILRYVGDCRKKVMRFYRLLGTKADVIKGFAKKCNEQWEVAPKSEIGLYLGDIQDHIVTMTGNLSHYENLLSRAHSNYLTQINLKMNERAEKTNDVLGKLTILGTIVLPMNIVTGLFGMNTRVPGEDGHKGDLTWFYGITLGLLIVGFICFFIARRSFSM